LRFRERARRVACAIWAITAALDELTRERSTMSLERVKRINAG
jgi:hypothetical protein